MGHFLPPHSLVAFCYTAGAVLLFGGVALFRAALFPILLTWFVNPVPNAFNLLIDLPLQHASAEIARAFAHMLGQPLTQDQLRLMFTPDFGMFIAPGCNGIRGAITMGFIALIAGYLYRFSLKYKVLTVAGAVLLGYLFNLIRLCVLVLYYIVALHITWLQSRAEMGDYIIGACLFLLATFLLFTIILRLSPTGSLRPPPLPLRKTPGAPVLRAQNPGAPVSGAPNPGAPSVPLHGTGGRSENPGGPSENSGGPSENPGGVSRASATAPADLRVAALAPRSFLPRFAAFALLIAIGSVSYARALADRDPGQAVRNPEALGHFPQHVGGYTLAREWNEYLVAGGPLIFYWADYAPDTPRSDQIEGGGRVSVGISPVLGAHDTLLCHSARGEDWLWHDALVLPTTQAPTSFSASFYNDGATQYLEATTVCTGGTCGQYSTPRQHFGFIYSRPDTHTLLTQSPNRPIPVLLRTETTDTAMAPDMARNQLVQNLREFLAAANLATFAHADREATPGS